MHKETFKATGRLACQAKLLLVFVLRAYSVVVEQKQQTKGSTRVGPLPSVCNLKLIVHPHCEVLVNVSRRKTERCARLCLQETQSHPSSVKILAQTAQMP